MNAKISYHHYKALKPLLQSYEVKKKLKHKHNIKSDVGKSKEVKLKSKPQTIK